MHGFKSYFPSSLYTPTAASAVVAAKAGAATAVFSTPELGTVGLPEHLARERHPNLDIYKARFRPMKATLGGRDERMLMKLLVDADDGKVVGCHIPGPDAAEIARARPKSATFTSPFRLTRMFSGLISRCTIPA